MISLTIQAPLIPEALPTNVYELTVISWHCDGNLKEETVTRYKPVSDDMERLLCTLEIIEAYKAEEEPFVTTRKEWEAFIYGTCIDIGPITNKADLGDWVTNTLVGYDILSDGDYLTTFDGYSLVFYDVNGLVRPVTVERTDGNN